jgi:hypothetical protein
MMPLPIRAATMTPIAPRTPAMRIATASGLSQNDFFLVGGGTTLKSRPLVVAGSHPAERRRDAAV